MPRLGLDFSLDSLGGGMGGIAACDLSSYWNGSANTTVDFVDDGSGNMIPVVGPMRFSVATPPNTITVELPSGLEYDPALDDTFEMDRLFRDEDVSGNYMQLWDSANANNYILVYHLWSGANVFRIQARTVATGLKTSNFVGGTQDTLETVGFNLSGAAATKTIVSTLGGVVGIDPEILDFTGVKFDRITIGDKQTLAGPSLDWDIYAIRSLQVIGNTNFVTRLPIKVGGTNVVSSDTGVDFVVNSAQYYPYYGIYTPVKIAYMGDSITNQYNYVGLLEASLDLLYPNAVHTKYAQNGWVSFQLAPAGFPIGDYTNGGEVVDPTRNIDKVLSDLNDIIVLYVGANDNTLGYEEAGVIAVYQAIIDDATTAGKQVIVVNQMSRVVGTPTTNAWANSLSATMRTEWSAYSNVYVADVNTDMGLGGANNYVDPLMTTDNVHPTTLGEQTQADAVEPHIETIIALNTWSTPYLKTDTLCAGNNLVTNNGIAVTNNGEFVINTP